MFSHKIARLRTLLHWVPILMKDVRATWRGYKQWCFYRVWRNASESRGTGSLEQQNPLQKYFADHKEGSGIWKWSHYFEIYGRHFSRFRGQELNVLEIGIYSGGSLKMWQSYFGPRCKIYGVDIEPSCKAYESSAVRVFIGDQADRNFWKQFKRQVPVLHIVIDDGGHIPEQQIVTVEELLPHLQPGGIYLCEDVHTPFNEFASYVHGLAQNLNAVDQAEDNFNDNERRIVCKAAPLQSCVDSIHLYPYVTVIERTATPISEFVAPKHGTQWEPFLK